LLEDVLKGVNALNEDNFRVRMNLYYVQKYKNKKEWESLGAVSTKDIKEHIAPLITYFKEDELAKRFDLVMYSIELAKLQGNNATRPIKSVIDTAEQLSKLGTIPQVQEQRDVINKVRTEEFWEDVNIFELDEVREALRELLKYLEKIYTGIYYTNFDDFVVQEEYHGAMYNVNNLKNYRKKVEYYLKEHENELAIYKLRNNKQLIKQDLKTLEHIMWDELGTEADYKKEFGDMPVNKLVRQLVGLDRMAANELFSQFFNNENLNSVQIHFVKLIVDYVVKNGLIDDNKILQEEPFRNIGSIIELFKNNMDDARNIMKIVSDIKRNAEVIV